MSFFQSLAPIGLILIIWAVLVYLIGRPPKSH